MVKLYVLDEQNSIFKIQKCYVSTDLLPRSSNGQFAIITEPNGMFFVCQIFIDRLLHPSYCKINKCVYGQSGSAPTLKGIKVNEIESNDISLVNSVENIKSMTVSIVLNSPFQTPKWKNYPKTNDIIKNILQLFVVKNNSIISLEGIKSLFDVAISFIIVDNVGKVNVGKITNSTKVRLNKVISKDHFEQIHESKEELPNLGGLDEPMQSLSKLIETCQSCNRNQSELQQAYKQVLLLGPSGCGKTTLVHRAARQCRAVIKVVLGPELCSPLPGDSERKLTSVFDECKLLADECEGGCILLLDQVETLCGRRNQSADSHLIRLSNHLFNLLESVHLTPGLMVVGTSSRPQSIDPAARRPGRFGHEIHVRVSGERERCSILRAVAGRLGLSDRLSEQVARWTPGFVAADLVLLANNVARHLLKIGLPLSFEDEGQLGACWRACTGRLQPSALRGQAGVVRADEAPPSELGGVAAVRRGLAQAIQWPLTDPEAFRRLGLPQPKGVLLYGPPGCAKTSLARDIAAATNTTFLSVSAAQIYSPYVGDAEKTIAELFHRARIGAPAILFIDEIDALVGCRGHRERGTQERILTTLLTEMDGIGVRVDNATTEGGVVVVAATNRPEVLDPALTRPGRFDRLIYVGPPDSSQRLEILRALTKKMPLATDVNLESLADKTNLFSGADLAQLSKEAGLNALATEGMSASEVADRHWQAALSTVKPSLSADQILHYQSFSFAR